jgi:hypothetical protein
MPEDKPAFAIPAQIIVHASTPEEAQAIADRLEGCPLDEIKDVDGFVSFSPTLVRSGYGW